MTRSFFFELASKRNLLHVPLIAEVNVQTKTPKDVKVYLLIELSSQGAIVFATKGAGPGDGGHLQIHTVRNLIINKANC